MFKKDLELFKQFYYDTKCYDEEYNDERDKLYDDLIEQEYGYYICREVVDKDYIKDIFEKKNIKGLLLINKETEFVVGFMMFTLHKKYINLKLLGTTEEQEERKGVKLGKLFLNILEVYARERNINIIKCDVVKESIDFYLKYGYKVIQKKADMYYVEKNLKDEINMINKIFEKDTVEEYNTESEEDDGDVKMELNDNKINYLQELNNEYYDEEMYKFKVDDTTNCLIM